jgi:hypothetical protein
MTFLLSEDKALREQLQGIIVTDQKSDADSVSRQVGVWFGQPDQELRTQNYPYITIDMIDIQRDNTREMRGYGTAPGYTNLASPQNYNHHLPIPVFIDYQVTSYARHPRHDREIISQLMGYKLPIRFGTLEVVEKTTVSGSDTLVTSTMRRLDVMAISKRDITEQAKRLFVNAITVRISSELPVETYIAVQKVNKVKLDQLVSNKYTSIGSFTLSA